MHTFELSPNCSLSARSATFFFGSIFAVSMAVAIGFASAGFWPVLLAASLELAGLGAALWWSRRQGERRELILIGERNVIVRKIRAGQATEIEFRRPWTHVVLEPAAARNWPNRLILRSMGRSVEVGCFLTDCERKSLKKRLTGVLWQAVEK